MFPLPYSNVLLHGEQLDCDEPKRQLLLLHGAGAASRASFMPLRQHLQQKGIASTVFDFIGHGQTSGSLIGSSLEHRVQQAETVLYACRHTSTPRALLGSSMGAYVALRLLAAHPCSHLILEVPGVYSPQAYQLPFGPAFSAVLRQTGSWTNSDAWDCLSTFRGHLLIVVAEQDQVIPPALTDRLYASATQVRSRQLLNIAGADHHLTKYWHSKPAAAQHYHQQLADFLLQP